MIFNYFIIIILYSQIFSVRKFVDNTMKNGYNIIMSFYDVVYEQVKKYRKARSRRTGKSRFMRQSARKSRRRIRVAFQSRSRFDTVLPCRKSFWRACTRICFRRTGSAKALLENDGVVVRDDFTVDLEKYGMR